ncbi:arabinosylfuranosidase ArfA [Phytoactinopolyspora halotolerans]|uniref:arabinosylfuranosidase ArfA n=1 Tax=Phytoactinopolyspora halotolerans TaxID=1981512 RepID=UPI001C205A73|nr:alpha-N-arabinofuranosidase [Phytoactinopolyspora halotolerans]
MYEITVALDPAFTVGPVDPRLFGSFVEHMGRCVYGGIFEPDHPTADEHGFRKDVAALVAELGTTVIRYPGGNFVSGYRWEDGVGPVENRPRRLDLAWRSIEPNTVGVDEFTRWARGVGIDPIMAVNLGTRGVRAAVDLLEYCNLPAGSTAMADWRARNGRPEPHAVRTWCLGNELDGPWQIGHKTADEYGRLAAETARAMRRADPDIELVACGSSNSGMPTFGSWERTVLEHTYDLVDHISLHAYYEPIDGDVDSFLASSENMRSMIDAVTATADHVAATTRSRKRLTVSFDEWNVWYQNRFPGEDGLEVRDGGPLIEDTFDVADAVVVGDLLMALLDKCDRVAIACQAQLVNVIGLIRTEPGGSAWRQTTFHPFALTARHARGTTLRTAVSTPALATARHGDVPAARVTAVHDAESGELVLLATNRHRTDPARLNASLASFGVTDDALIEHVTIADADPHATNTAEHPDRIHPRPVSGTEIADGRLTATLAPLSWHLIRIRTAQQ